MLISEVIQIRSKLNERIVKLDAIWAENLLYSIRKCLLYNLYSVSLKKRNQI